MKIDINQIPPQGMILEEDILPSSLDLETETVKFHEPVHVKAKISKASNIILVKLNLAVPLYHSCSRCLSEFNVLLNKDINLNYPFDKTQSEIILDSDIRQEIIIEYPIKSLCKPDCRGLCQKCGKNLNNEKCNC